MKDNKQFPYAKGTAAKANPDDTMIYGVLMFPRLYKYLCRGKSAFASGEWVEGFYVAEKYFLDDSDLYSYISVPHPEDNDRGSDLIPVQDNTIGFCLGGTDKNNYLIYEGDLVKDDRNGDVVFEVVYLNSGLRLGFYLKGLDKDSPALIALRPQRFEHLTICGNIYDNPIQDDEKGESHE